MNRMVSRPGRRLGHNTDLQRIALEARTISE